MGKTGPAPSKSMRTPAAVAVASATGTIDRGRYSNSSSSMASSTADTGLPNVAAMPAAAPAASSVLRSTAVVDHDLPDQRAERPAGGDDRPLGAERPAGADGDRGASGLRNVIRGGMRLWFSSTCSIASGMPWPRIAFDP